MQSALKIQTTVTSEGKIEISRPELTPGKVVEVIVLLPDLKSANDEPVSAKQLSAIDILNQLPGQRLFKTATEVETHLRQERDAWDT